MTAVMEKVQAELNAEPAIRCCTISVDCVEGLVVLAGNVRTYYQKQMAQEAARRVINKKIPYLALTVRNDLRVAVK